MLFREPVLMPLTGFILTLFATFILIGQANAENQMSQAKPVAGRILTVSGEADLLPQGQQQWQVLSAGQSVYPGDLIKTGSNGKISLLMADETLMQLNRNTRLLLKEVGQNAGWLQKTSTTIKTNIQSAYDISKGQVWARNKNRNVKINFEMPSVTAGIRGTELTLDVSDDGTVLTRIVEGRVEHSNDFGQLVAEAGEQIYTRPGTAPVRQLLVNPMQAVQWTIAIPAIDLLGEDILSQTRSQAISQHLHQLLTEEKYLEALNEIQTLNKTSPNSTLNTLDTLEATLLIYTGDPITAQIQLQAIPESTRNDSYWRAAAITDIMLNQYDEALKAARAAVALNDKQAYNFIILSYAHLARAELELADLAANRAIKTAAPGSPAHIAANLLSIRILFGSDYTEHAWERLLSVQTFAPDNAELNNLAGYILIARHQIDDAEYAFNQALKHKPGLAEPHMGLGIVWIRRGQIDQALEEITMAVAIEPQRAIFLSYWGKMLYQIQRFDKALDMFEHAGKLDPNDPTPDFYKAIILRDLNRPGEAITAMHSAIAKNDNRGVYRSRYLLDQDLASRNVDLSNLYSELGLERWASAHATAAIKQDYSNYSAHLFLAGSFSEQASRTYTYASEALLARLLMPANINSFNTFNDYTVLFEQPETGGQLTLAAGTQHSAQLEAIGYGAQPDNNVAWGVAALGSTTNGWRDTNQHDMSSLGVLGKWSPVTNNSLFLSALLSRDDRQDKIYPLFEYDNAASPEDNRELKLASIELGLHQHLSAQSDFLAYITHKKTDGDHKTVESMLVVPPALYTRTDTNLNSEQPYSQLQLQYIQGRSQQNILGAFVYRTETSQTGVEQIDAVDQGAVPPQVTPLFTNTLSARTESVFYSIYAQHNRKLTNTVQMEAALYYDKLDLNNLLLTTSFTNDKLNPRIGLIWNPETHNTLRLAAFRYTLPAISARTDPTDIAGIGVYRNAREGTQTEELAATWEYQSAQGFYATKLYQYDSKAWDTSLENSTRGAELEANYLYDLRTGIFASWHFEDIEDRINPDLARKDHLFKAGFRHQIRPRLSAGLTQIFRSMNFNSTRSDENIGTTNTDVRYEFENRTGSVSLYITNLFDKQFNWVTDEYTSTGQNPAREIMLSTTVNF